MNQQEMAYLDTAFRIFVGEEPAPNATTTAKCRAVMAAFDGRKLNNDDRLERVARVALCVIGLRWHPSDNNPYGWSEIAERVRELTPTLGAAPVDPELLRNLLRADREGRTVVSSVRR